MGTETGPPEYEALDVTCILEFDEDSLTLKSLTTIQRAVDSAIAACGEALQDGAAGHP